MSSSGVFDFEGYIGVVITKKSIKPEVFLDNGTLKMADGRIFAGDFSITYYEGAELQYALLTSPESLTLTQEPHIFFGSYKQGPD